MAELSDLLVASLGEPRFESPLAEFVADRRTNEHYVDEDDRVVFHDTVFQLSDLAVHRRSFRVSSRAGRDVGCSSRPVRRRSVS